MNSRRNSRRGFLKKLFAIFAGKRALLATFVSTRSLNLLAAVHDIKLEVLPSGNGYTYNGKSPGETIKAKPGDAIDIELVNSLPAKNDDCPENHNLPHGINTTNLHTHGLHVSPYKDSSGSFDADNVFLKVVPKDQVVDDDCWNGNFRRHKTKYRIELPEDHPAGTHWYHAHKHGSTARQVGGGLYGPIVIEDPAGSMPKYIESAAPECTFMITAQGGVSMVLAESTGGGQLNPTIQLNPGSVERWRIINASPFANSFVHLSAMDESIELWQIAYDGLTLPKRIKVDPNNNNEPWLNPAALAPGNRTDLMVRVRKTAENTSYSVAANTAPTRFLNAMPASTMSTESTASEASINIVVRGEPVDDLWSTDDILPGSGHQPIIESELPKRTVEFGQNENGDFVIDGELYDGKVKKRIKLGSSEQWTILNTTDGTHPFHIHVNPFFITHIDGKLLPLSSPLRRWQDTVAIPNAVGDTPGSITFNTRFSNFKGEFVIHCHILSHEDFGMMQKVEVI